MTEDYVTMCGECGYYNVAVEGDAKGCSNCHFAFGSYTTMYDGMRVGYRADASRMKQIVIVSVAVAAWAAIAWTITGVWF